MEALYLVAPDMRYASEIAAFRAELLASGEDIAGGGSLSAFDRVEDWLNYLALKSSPETCPAGLVPDSTYLSMRKADNRLVGIVNIRHQLNDLLLEWGGHVGYSIRPGERGKGYARPQLRLALEKCRELGLERVLITCNETNLPSLRTIEGCEGIYEDTRPDSSGNPTRRYWVHL